MIEYAQSIGVEIKSYLEFYKSMRNQ